MSPAVGRYIIIIGILVVIVGVVVYFFGNRLGFLGRLPGDIRIEGEKGGFYFPIVTCILLSVIISVVVRIIQWFMQR